MDASISKIEIQRRLHSHFESNYIVLISIIKGVTLANAVDALFLLFPSVPTNWELFLLWLAAFIAMVMTYDATIVGMLVVSVTPNVLDILLPFLLGTSEYIMFSFVKGANPLGWHVTFVMFNAAASILLTNVIWRLKKEHYDIDVQPLALSYRDMIVGDRKLAVISICLWIGVFAAGGREVLSVIAVFLMTGALRSQERQRQKIRSAVY